MTRHSFQKSTIVRLRGLATHAGFALSERLAPSLGGRVAERIWFTLPPTPREHPDDTPATPSTPFTIQSQDTTIRGATWGSGPVVYLVHGWGGRGSQLHSFVDPLVRAGHQVVAFDAPSHGGSEPGPSGPQRSTVVELARALDDVAARFGPAHAVVAHSLGAMATMLAMEHGWLGVRRLALVAPMLDVATALDVFTAALGVGPRTRKRLERRIARWVGMPIEEFSPEALVSAGIPTFVAHDHGDRQSPYDDSAVFVSRHQAATLLSTSGLGHQRILRDPDVVKAVAAHVVDEAQDVVSGEVDLAS